MQQEPRQGLPPMQYSPQPQPPPKSSGGGGMTGFAIALVVAALVSFGMMQFLGAKKADIAAIQNTVDGFNSRITAVEGRVIPPDLSIRMADVEAKVRTATTVDTSGLVEKSVYDAKIKALEDAIDALKTTTGTDIPGSTTGVVSITTSPTSISIGSGTTVAFTIQITNGTNQWKYIRPILVLSSSVQSAIVTDPTVIMQSGSYTIQTADISYMPTLGATLRTSYSGFPQTGGQNSAGEFYLGPGQSIPISVSISVASSPAVIWTITVEKQERI